MKLKFINTLIIITMFGFFSNLSGQKANDEALISLIKEGAFLVDVRTPMEFAEGSAKGAVNIPLDQIGNQMAKFKNKKNIVVFCRSGARSGQAKSILEQNGIKNVTNGGTWQNVNQAATAKK
jgi:phage shock protein E